MKYEERVPTELIKEGHYLGRPADFDDKIIRRRVELVKAIPNFCNKELELLDIGCGNGASIFLLAPEMKFCLGVEIETTHLPEFNKYKEEHHITNCDCVIRDIEKEKLDKQFDRIISFEVIEHLKDDKNVSNYYDMLNPGGLMAITVPNKWWVFETHGAKLPLLPWNRVPFFSWLPRPIHERFANARIYTMGRIIKLLTDAGFEILDKAYITAPMDVLKEGKLKRWLLKNVFRTDTTKNPMLSTSIFVVARKKGL
jgi:2-polyprenyl-3-methyl-5-hydroxy-6-metoxy-1,4-benzoquinol methylase